MKNWSEVANMGSLIFPAFFYFFGFGQDGLDRCGPYKDLRVRLGLPKLFLFVGVFFRPVTSLLCQIQLSVRL